MALWKILIGWIMLLVTIQAATATFVEISTNNLTWTNITQETYRGRINETNKSSSVLLLQEETVYYFRTYNETHDVTYFHQRTKGEGNLISIMIGLIAFVSIFALMTILIKNLYVRLVCFMLTMGSMWVIYGYILRIAVDVALTENTIKTLTAGYELMAYSYVTIIGLIMLYMFYTVMIDFMFIWKKRKKRKEDEENGTDTTNQNQ